MKLQKYQENILGFVIKCVILFYLFIFIETPTCSSNSTCTGAMENCTSGACVCDSGYFRNFDGACEGKLHSSNCTLKQAYSQGMLSTDVNEVLQ